MDLRLPATMQAAQSATLAQSIFVCSCTEARTLVRSLNDIEFPMRVTRTGEGLLSPEN